MLLSKVIPSTLIKLAVPVEQWLAVREGLYKAELGARIVD